MDLGTIANVATAAAVVTGVVFGIVEVAHARLERRERAAMEVLHAMMTPEYMRSVAIIHELPAGAGVAELRSRGERALDAAHSLAMIFETLGYEVFRRMVPIRMADDLVGGAVRVSWQRLRPYVEEVRRTSGSNKAWEWFEWLASRLDEHCGPLETKTGAHELYRRWRP